MICDLQHTEPLQREFLPGERQILQVSRSTYNFRVGENFPRNVKKVLAHKHRNEYYSRLVFVFVLFLFF